MKVNTMKRLFLIITIVLCLVTVSSAIQVSGDVWGVWNADDNPYEVIGDLRVPPGSTLVIEPGCYIDFQGHYKFIIDTSATLQAIGTERDSIIFTTADTAIGWLGLRFFSVDNSCLLSYCIIEWGKAATETDTVSDFSDYYGGGVFCNNSDLSVICCLIRNNESWTFEGGGIYSSNSNLDIIGNRISYNHAGMGGAGIFCVGSNAVITNNTINDNVTWYPLGGEDGGVLLAILLMLKFQITLFTIIFQV